MKKPGYILAVIAAAALTLISCSKEEGPLEEGKGRINVHLTDAPFPIGMVSSTEVTIDKVEIRQSLESGSESDEGTFILLAEGEMTFDLLELTNGITEQIASADLPAGSYDMIRLHVNGSTVTLKDGTTFDLKIPSGSTSGLKIKIEPVIQLTEGETSDVLLDFDLSKSFVVNGNINGIIKGFIFKPVVRGVLLGAAGRIQGTVTNAEDAALEHAILKLWAQENGTIDWDAEKMLISAFSESNGSYKLIGLPVGTYSIISELEGYKNDTLKNIEVTAGHSSIANFKLEAMAE